MKTISGRLMKKSKLILITSLLAIFVAGCKKDVVEVNPAPKAPVITVPVFRDLVDIFYSLNKFNARGEEDQGEFLISNANSLINNQARSLYAPEQMDVYHCFNQIIRSEFNATRIYITDEDQEQVGLTYAELTPTGFYVADSREDEETSIQYVQAEYSDSGDVRRLTQYSTRNTEDGYEVYLTQKEKYDRNTETYSGFRNFGENNYSFEYVRNLGNSVVEFFSDDSGEVTYKGTAKFILERSPTIFESGDPYNLLKEGVVSTEYNFAMSESTFFNQDSNIDEGSVDDNGYVLPSNKTPSDDILFESNNTISSSIVMTPNGTSETSITIGEFQQLLFTKVYACVYQVEIAMPETLRVKGDKLLGK